MDLNSLCESEQQRGQTDASSFYLNSQQGAFKIEAPIENKWFSLFYGDKW